MRWHSPKVYIFPLLFYKPLCDAWEEEYARSFDVVRPVRLEDALGLVDATIVVDASLKEATRLKKVVEDVTRRIGNGQAIAWDKAVRGKHIAAFLQLGLLPLIKVHGRKNKKPTYIETIEVTLDDGSVHKLRLYALPDGSAAIKVVNQGQEALVPLDTKQAHVRRHTMGTSWFIESVIRDGPEVPAELRNATAWWRPQDSTDAERSLRIAEHLRIHGEDTDYFQHRGGYWTRNTAETVNGWLKEDLHQGRARSVTQNAQHLDMIGAGIYRNLQTDYMARRRAADPPTPALAA